MSRINGDNSPIDPNIGKIGQQDQSKKSAKTGSTTSNHKITILTPLSNETIKKINHFTTKRFAGFRNLFISKEKKQLKAKILDSFNIIKGKKSLRKKELQNFQTSLKSARSLANSINSNKIIETLDKLEQLYLDTTIHEAQTQFESNIGKGDQSLSQLSRDASGFKKMSPKKAATYLKNLKPMLDLYKQSKSDFIFKSRNPQHPLLTSAKEIVKSHVSTLMQRSIGSNDARKVNTSLIKEKYANTSPKDFIEKTGVKSLLKEVSVLATELGPAMQMYGDLIGHNSNDSNFKDIETSFKSAQTFAGVAKNSDLSSFKGMKGLFSGSHFKGMVKGFNDCKKNQMQYMSKKVELKSDAQIKYFDNIVKAASQSSIDKKGGNANVKIGNHTINANKLVGLLDKNRATGEKSVRVGPYISKITSAIPAYHSIIKSAQKKIISQLANDICAKNPDLSKDEVKKDISENLNQYVELLMPSELATDIQNLLSAMNQFEKFKG